MDLKKNINNKKKIRKKTNTKRLKNNVQNNL